MLNLALQEKGGYGLFDWPPRMVPEWPLQLHNFPDALSQSPFGRYFLNSTIIAVLSMAGTVLSSSIAGYVFARMRFPGRDILFIVMLATLMVPPQVTLIPQFILFKSLGWYDSWYPLWGPALDWHCLRDLPHAPVLQDASLGAGGRCEDRRRQSAHDLLEDIYAPGQTGAGHGCHSGISGIVE